MPRCRLLGEVLGLLATLGCVLLLQPGEVTQEIHSKATGHNWALRLILPLNIHIHVTAHAPLDADSPDVFETIESK